MKEKNTLKKVLIVGGGILLGTVAVLVGKKTLDAKKGTQEDCYDSDEDYTDSEE